MEQFLISDQDSAASRESELPCREVDYVELISDLSGDIAHRHVLALLITQLYEVEIILQQRRIEDRHNTVLSGYGAGILEICEASEGR